MQQSNHLSDRHLYVGLMSGTSMDGITAVLVDFSNQNHPQILEKSVTHYPDPLRAKLESLVSPSWCGSLKELAAIDHQVAQHFSCAAQSVIKACYADQVHAIGSHGQTVFHLPAPSSPNSLQIGDPNVIAEETQVTVVADFRRRDMAAGGQGAPLVPAFHQFLFGKRHDQAVLNLGGIANVTMTNQDGEHLGYDTGPANTLIDQWIFGSKNHRFDAGGQWAKQGIVDTTLLNTLLSDRYFSSAPPKSTGREYFNLDWVFEAVNAGKTEISDVDLQRTLTELTARSVADSLCSQRAEIKRLIVCGGGAHNTFLMDRIRMNLPDTEVVNSRELGIAPDDIEAMAFAWLAKQTLSARPGNISSATGARGPRILGGIYQA